MACKHDKGRQDPSPDPQGWHRLVVDTRLLICLTHPESNKTENVLKKTNRVHEVKAEHEWEETWAQSRMNARSVLLTSPFHLHF